MADNASTAIPHDATTPTTGRGWQITWGVLLIVAGVAAILMPGIAALATVLFFGWLLAFGGVFEIAYAIHTRAQQGFGWKLVSVLQGRCPPSLLHTYSAERRAIAAELIDFDREWSAMLASNEDGHSADPAET